MCSGDGYGVMAMVMMMRRSRRRSTPLFMWPKISPLVRAFGSVRRGNEGYRRSQTLRRILMAKGHRNIL